MTPFAFSFGSIKSYITERESLDPETIELMSGIKKAFDPKNILNPHKVFQS